MRDGERGMQEITGRRRDKRGGGVFMMKLGITYQGEKQGSQISGAYIYSQSNLQLNI